MDEVKKVEKKLDVKLLLIGVVVHLIIFYSIFDVYFKSPLIHGMEPVRRLSDEKSPAKRLCLFVADGLRADTFFNLIEKETSMYLSKKRFSDGRFAISTTQVPTESRPGHVAMIAGFYEDISAVAKGWKENPVEFDSVFNQSNYTWSFGSPDILTMFQKSSPHVFARTYDASIEDFAAENASVLDTWVMHHFKKFLYHSQVNRTETKMLNQDGVVFFLHLLGIDTHGHSKKPHSQEYISNIFVVDDIVRKSVDLLNDHFKEDNQTVFIFTADHGMTDWGSHGSGDDSERLTPFVAWGAGIKPSPYDRNNLDNIEQVDISPLMSYLIGVPIPLNSIGKIPLDFLNVSVREKSFAFKQNALQIIQQLKIKREQIKSTAIYFQEFSELTISMVNNMLETVEQLIEKENYSQAIEKMDHLIELSLRALDYYHKYHKFYLGICIVLSCVGWIVYLFINNLSQTFNLENYLISAKRSSVLNNIFLILMVLMILISFYQKFPITFYLYGGLPILLWWNILSKYNLVGFLSETWSNNKLKNTLNFVLMIIGIEFMVLSFFYRWIFSFLLIIYSCLLARLKVHPNQTRFKLAFVICSLVLAFFPLLPVIKGYNHFYLVYASCLISNAIYIWLMNKFEILSFNKKLSVLLMVLNVASAINIIWIRTSIDFNYGLPRVNQIFSHLMIPCCFLLPIFCEPLLKKRLTFILFTLVNLYQHLSISYEGIFIVVLCLQMVSWLFIEAFFYSGTFNVDTAINKKRSSYFVTNYEDEQSDDAKWFDVFRVYLLIFYLLLAFFGTGNMASINSFDPVSVYCFITVFSPFQMGILLFLKIMVVPFLIVIAIFYCIYEATDLSMRTSFTILMIFSDLMALHFFFLIRTAGSWLDIGISISHYIIVMVTIIIVSLLFSIAQYLFKFEIMRIGLMRSIKNHILKFD